MPPPSIASPLPTHRRSLLARIGWAVGITAAALLAVTAAAAAPTVENGVIDLSGWNFSTDGPVALDGEWRFFWQRFLPVDAPEDPDAATVAVPYVWNDHRIAATAIGGTGYATYRLRIRLPAAAPPLGLHIIDAATACTFYANGQVIYTAGVPAAAREDAVPHFQPAVVALPASAGDLDLLVHISNHHHRQGGLWDRITIGAYGELRALRERRIVFNMVLFGSLLLMGLYHLGLFGMRRMDLSPLYFGLGCLTVLLRTVSTGERYLIQLFPAFPFELLSKLEYWGFYLAIGCFSLFIGSLFPKECDRRIIVGFAVLSALFSGLVLITPLRVYSYSTPLFEIITLAALGYGVLTLWRAIANHRAGAGIFLAGFTFLAATAVNDILYSRQYIHTVYMVQFGLLIFILAQALLLSRRMSELFATVESQQAAIQVSEKKYRTLVDNASEAIFIVQDGRFTFVNPRTEALFGYSADTLQALPFISCVHPDDRAGAAAHLTRILGSHGDAGTLAFRLIQRSGKTVWAQLNAVATQWEGRPAVLNLLSDVDQRKRLEDRLHRARKMEALGTLAGGIALDFDRFIAHVMRETDAMMADRDAGRETAGHRQRLLAACVQARRLVASVLSFSRPDAGDMQPRRIAEEVENAIQLLQFTVPRQVTLRTDIAARETVVNAKGDQVSEVVLNLAANALDAMKEGAGTLYIALHEVALTRGTTSAGSSLPPGRYARLTVADTGVGIPEAIRDRVFDPYFTTKAAGEGTGMGLAAVMGIVKSHKGEIDLISTPDMGTTVHVYFPILDAAAGTAPETIQYI